ncbi:MAG: type II TA system antitoxin MqsA family protein [Acidobacteriota bacterium]
MKCVECGKGRMQRKLTRVPHDIRGIRFEVEDRVNVCSHCGFITIPLDQADEHGRLTDQIYRRLAGILTTEEIREARRRLRMNQREFAEYLGVGEASVKRWETGVLPDKSSSDLIRLKTDPEAARANYDALRSRLGLRQPEKLTIVLDSGALTQQQGFSWQSVSAYLGPGALPRRIQ